MNIPGKDDPESKKETLAFDPALFNEELPKSNNDEREIAEEPDPAEFEENKD